MTDFDSWVQNCQKQGLIIRKMAERGRARLYMTKKPYMLDNQRFWTEPIYQVWVKGEWRGTTRNYLNAYAILLAEVEK